MSSNELAFASTQQLIDELIARKTFAGVLICSDQEHKFDFQNHENFKLYTTIEREGTISVLQNGIDQLCNV